MSIQPKTVLFVSYGGGHATMLAPVIKALSDRNVRVRVLGLTMAGQTYNRENIPFLGFKDFLLPTDTQALEIGERLAAKMHSDHTGIPREESVAYLGLSYVDLLHRLGSAEGEKQFANRGRQAFLPLSIIERIFDRLKPDLVVTTNSPRAEEAARIVAKSRSIPTVVITDLLGHEADASLLERQRPMDVTHLCAISQTALERYSKSTIVNAEKYHLAGNPAIDKALNYSVRMPEADKQTLYPKLSANSKYVLYTETVGYINAKTKELIRWKDEQILQNLERVYKSTRDAGAVLLVRPHPSMNPDLFYNWASQKAKGSAYVADKIDLYRLFQLIDLLAANLSTVMLEALYMNVPLLIVHYPDSETTLPFDKMGFAFSAAADDQEDLTAKMNIALNDSKLQKEYFEKFKREFPALPSAPRIAEIILKQLY